MNRHQIIADIPDTADDPITVLFDFDDWFGLASASVDPAETEYATSSSFLFDGDNVDATRRGNRLIEMGLNAFKGNAEDQAEVLQTLARLLADPRGQWLLWHDEGTVNPRYYRTIPTTFSTQDLILDEDPKRVVPLRIPAEPNGFGDKVVGNVVVNNDPSAGTNPLCFHLTDVKGDVPVPISMKIAGAGPDAFCLIGSSGSSSNPATLPRSSSPISTSGAGFGWSRTANFADTDAVGGVTDRWLFSNITLRSGIAIYSLVLPGPGDWRVLVRARGNDTLLGIVGAPKRSAVASTYGWVDLGIQRLPRGPRRTAPSGISDGLASSPSVSVSLDPTANGAAVYLDEVIAVPAGLDDATVTSILFAGWSASADLFVVEGVEDAVWSRLTGIGGGFSHASVEGALPRVAPDVDNLISFIRTVDYGGDVLADTVSIDYQYRPEYLGVRSATG